MNLFPVGVQACLFFLLFLLLTHDSFSVRGQRALTYYEGHAAFASAAIEFTGAPVSDHV